MFDVKETIESLTLGQSSNAEAVRVLADSISYISAVISCLKENKVRREVNRDESGTTEAASNVNIYNQGSQLEVGASNNTNGHLILVRTMISVTSYAGTGTTLDKLLGYMIT